MKVTHQENGEQGLFLLFDDQLPIGEMHYRQLDSQTIVIDHTSVNERYRGQGLARQLVLAGVQFARDQQLAIVPACSYVEALFRNSGESFTDVAHYLDN